MDQVQQLLKPELLIMAAAFVGGYQVVWRIFDAVKILPAFPLWLVPVAMLPTAFGLAVRYSQLNPIPAGLPRTLADDWWVQGFFLLFVMLSGWLGALLAFNGKPSNGTSSSSALGRAMNTNVLLLAPFLLWAFLISGATVASADEKDVLRWDTKRISVGFRGWGVVHEDLVPDQVPTASAIKLDTYANWNLSRRLNVFAGFERELADQYVNGWKAGASGQLMGTEKGSRFALFMGAYAIRRTGPGAESFVKRDSWEAYLQGAWILAQSKGGRNWLGLVAAAKYDPNNNYPTGQLGLDFQPIGGKQ